MDKTQTMKLGVKSSTTELELLGVKVDYHGKFRPHNASMVKAAKTRLGQIRRLRSHLSLGREEKKVARAFFIGKIATNCWVTREARLAPDVQVPGHDAEIQVIINNLARHLTGTKREDKVKVSTLLDKSNLPSINELTVHGAAVAAWKAANGGVLESLYREPDARTRSATNGLKEPISSKCIAACNMSKIWNESSELRAAKSLPVAKKVAKKLAREKRML